jgi:uncharacterized protein YndB with AHSA1/START domain
VNVTEIDAIASEIFIEATPEVVFAYFVDADKMVRWMGSRIVDVDPRPGGVYALDINAMARARGEYLEVVPHSRVVFSFGWEDDQSVPPGSSRVEVTLTPERDGTHVRLVHRGLQTVEMREQHAHGWQLYLSRLRTAAEGGDPGADPNSQ